MIYIYTTHPEVSYPWVKGCHPVSSFWILVSTRSEFQSQKILGAIEKANLSTNDTFG